MVSILGRIVETVGGRGDSSHRGVHCEVRCFYFMIFFSFEWFHTFTNGKVVPVH